MQIKIELVAAIACMAFMYIWGIPQFLNVAPFFGTTTYGWLVFPIPIGVIIYFIFTLITRRPNISEKMENMEAYKALQKFENSQERCLLKGNYARLGEEPITKLQTWIFKVFHRGEVKYLFVPMSGSSYIKINTDFYEEGHDNLKGYVNWLIRQNSSLSDLLNISDDYSKEELEKVSLLRGVGR